MAVVFIYGLFLPDSSRLKWHACYKMYKSGSAGGNHIEKCDKDFPRGLSVIHLIACVPLKHPIFRQQKGHP